jgi:putative glutamine amidotransferase
MADIKKPLIGITLDSIDPNKENFTSTYSAEFFYALRNRYTSAVEQAGGIALCLPHHLNSVSDYANCLDGLLITGGGFDIDPIIYNETDKHDTIKTKPERTKFELAICKEFSEKNKPIFGICGGMQLINVAFGGKLHQHVPDFERENPIDHLPKIPPYTVAHTIDLVGGSLLSSFSDDATVHVNSIHHQAVKSLAHGFRVNAMSEDGIIEGIESINHHFLIGVQWHPEFLLNSLDKILFQCFISASIK